MSAQKGRLLGIGVGPGDPELITLKALRLLQSAAVVGYFVAKAKANKGHGGNAFGIIEQHLTDTQQRLPLVYPVTTEKLAAPLSYEDVISDFYDTTWSLSIARLELSSADDLKPWFGRLRDWHLVSESGRTKATRYFVAPEWLRGSGLEGKTTLTRIEPHRLRALILEDLQRYPGSSSSEINTRIGGEISDRTVKRALDELIDQEQVRPEGERRWRRYWLADHSS